MPSSFAISYLSQRLFGISQVHFCISLECRDIDQFFIKIDLHLQDAGHVKHSSPHQIQHVITKLLYFKLLEIRSEGDFCVALALVSLDLGLFHLRHVLAPLLFVALFGD